MARLLFPLLLALAVLLTPAVEAQAERPAVDVALDPGHSWADVGASYGGIGEYRLTLDLAFRTRAYLEAAGLTVRLTREDDNPLTAMAEPDPDERTHLEQHARIDAGAPARVFVSLHFNGGLPAWHGTETYYNPDRDPSAAADASLAEALQRHVVAALAESGYATLDRGAKSDLAAGKPYGHFFSLRGPMPSALVESLFLSNPTEAALLREGATLDALARGVGQGILEYLAAPAV
jgi:N-acetylmuramoyl-L-alanine amidase